MDDFMTMIEDFDATFEKHRKQVETLIRRQATSRKVAKHFRLNVLKRQLESGRLLPSQIQDRTRFEPDLVQLAIAASKSLARGNSVTSQHDFLGSSDSSGGGSSGGGGGDGGGRSMPRRPEGGYPQHQQHNNFSAGSREIRRHRRPRQSTTAQQQLRDTQNAKAMVAANKAARSFHPLVHVFGNRNGVQDGIHVTEGGACDYYNVRLVRRPTSLVHIAIQDSHLQTIIEPRVLRFSEQDWSTPQLVCVSAIDDTDKSSESVESTVLEHVTASGDKDYNDIRFEVPVHIADNDGYYLWGFGSNAHRQFGVDDVGPGACLPASITCELIEENGDDHEKDNDFESGDSDGQDDNDNEDRDRRRGGVGVGVVSRRRRHRREKEKSASTSGPALSPMPRWPSLPCYSQAWQPGDTRRARLRQMEKQRCMAGMTGRCGTGVAFFSTHPSVGELAPSRPSLFR